MNLPRRKFLHLAVGAAALPALSRMALAQTYPTRPVRIIVPNTPGGSNDQYVRLIAQWLSERLGQPFVIENRPGAGSNIGTEAVVRSPADGYTLLSFGPGSAINATLYDKLNFNFIRDIAPVAALSLDPGVLVVNPSVPVKTIPEFIAFAKANPGKLNMASTGIGSLAHVAGELFKAMTGVNILHVPYRGGPPAFTDLLGGQVQLMFPTLSGAIEYGIWYRRTQKYARSDHRQTEQRDQRGAYGSQDQRADHRPWRHDACPLARRLWQAHC